MVGRSKVFSRLKTALAIAPIDCVVNANTAYGVLDTLDAMRMFKAYKFRVERGPRMGISEQVLEDIVRRVLSVAKPDKIILFGSAAAGRMTRDSDIDLLIVEPDISRQRSEYVRIRKALWGIDYPFDILFISREWFDQSKDVAGGIAHPASKYGKVIYEAA